jgi:hypothetical protein
MKKNLDSKVIICNYKENIGLSKYGNWIEAILFDPPKRIFIYYGEIFTLLSSKLGNYSRRGALYHNLRTYNILLNSDVMNNLSEYSFIISDMFYDINFVELLNSNEINEGIYNFTIDDDSRMVLSNVMMKLQNICTIGWGVSNVLKDMGVKYVNLGNGKSELPSLNDLDNFEIIILGYWKPNQDDLNKIYYLYLNNVFVISTFNTAYEIYHYNNTIFYNMFGVEKANDKLFAIYNLNYTSVVDDNLYMDYYPLYTLNNNTSSKIYAYYNDNIAIMLNRSELNSLLFIGKNLVNFDENDYINFNRILIEILSNDVLIE